MHRDRGWLEVKDAPPRILLYLFAGAIWVIFLAYLVPHHYLAR